MDLPPQIFCSNERVLCACWRGAVRGVMMCGAIIGSNALSLSQHFRCERVCALLLAAGTITTIWRCFLRVQQSSSESFMLFCVC